ncbi:MAG: divalent-cation tolerance protein CutA [Thermodesulfovibrionia bacterium]|nr:divalent-cation tolerance protein CutA [Thermodesulfovibrionia bacterium]
MSKPNEIVVLVTVPDEDEAARIAQALVKEKLAACANIITNIRSIYRWEGAIEDAQEVLMVAKTQRRHFSALSAKVRERHSYSVPEIIALPITEGSEDYLKWLNESTRTD